MNLASILKLSLTFGRAETLEVVVVRCLFFDALTGRVNNNLIIAKAKESKLQLLVVPRSIYGTNDQPGHPCL